MSFITSQELNWIKEVTRDLSILTVSDLWGGKESSSIPRSVEIRKQELFSVLFLRGSTNWIPILNYLQNRGPLNKSELMRW